MQRSPSVTRISSRPPSAGPLQFLLGTTADTQQAVTPERPRMPASLPPDDQAIDPTPVPEQPVEQAAATTTKPKSQMTQSRLPLKPTKPPDKPSAP